MGLVFLDGFGVGGHDGRGVLVCFSHCMRGRVFSVSGGFFGLFLGLVFLAFPCIGIGLLASPLCGAGTYFSLPAAKKSRQKKAAQTVSA